MIYISKIKYVVYTWGIYQFIDKDVSWIVDQIFE
jgi:hypothetical protein